MDAALFLETQRESATPAGAAGGRHVLTVALLLSLAAHTGLGLWLRQLDRHVAADTRPRAMQVTRLASFATSLEPRPAAAMSAKEPLIPQPGPLQGVLAPPPPLLPLALAPTLDPAPRRPETPARSVAAPRPERPARKRARAESAPAVTRARDGKAMLPKLIEIGAPESGPPPAAMPASEDGAEAVTVVESPAPQYPFSARRLGIEGTVRLRLLVNAQGRPDRIDVKNPSGSAVLDRAAESGLRRWRFRPAREAGAAVARWVEIAVCFKLTGQATGYALGTASSGECRG